MNDWIWSFKSYISVWIDSIENCDRIPHFLNEKALAYWTRFAWFCAFNLCPFKTFDFDRFDRRDCDRKFVIDADRFGSILHRFWKVKLLSSFRLVLRQFDPSISVQFWDWFDQSFYTKSAQVRFNSNRSCTLFNSIPQTQLIPLKSKPLFLYDSLSRNRRNFNDCTNSRFLFVMQRNLELAFDGSIRSFKTWAEIDPL